MIVAAATELVELAEADDFVSSSGTLLKNNEFLVNLKIALLELKQK